MGEHFGLHLALHLVGLTVALVAGSWLIAWVLGRLRLVNAATESAGPRHAGRIIGLAERFLIYLMVVLGQPQLLAALIAVKTFVRYPEVKAARETSPEDNVQRHFAEYYLVGTLTSVAFGVAVPLACEGLYRVLIAA